MQPAAKGRARRTAPVPLITAYPPPVEGPEDRAWEGQLLRLLSELEFFRAGLEERPGHAGALELLTGMAGLVVSFAEHHISAATHAAALADVTAKAGDFFTTTRALQEQLTASPLRSLLRLFGSPAPSAAERREDLRRVGCCALAVLQDHFALFGRNFASATPAERWAETYGVFLADLSRVIE